jgi:hypothetical protein
MSLMPDHFHGIMILRDGVGEDDCMGDGWGDDMGNGGDGLRGEASGSDVVDSKTITSGCFAPTRAHG